MGRPTALTTPLGEFGAPPDVAAWTALAAAAITIVIAVSPPLTARLVRNRSDRWLVALLAIFAGALSWLYVVFYLRGGPRIIDATTYFFQGRALSEGFVRAPIPWPSSSFRGRFLLSDPAGQTITGIFPPGYPAILALGFLAGAPLLVGPIIAALLVLATYGLALRCTSDRRTALLAASLSAFCGVLRYHTADTMSHGWSALLLSTSVWAALGDQRRTAAVSGASAGWLFATRPITGVLGFGLAILGARRPRRIAWMLGAALVPIAAFLFQQRVATGSWFRSTQSAYYAVADGPAGCFRYGFGAGIGCMFEHGDFVRAHLAAGFGALAAAGTTLRRLKMHLADAGNAEPFTFVLIYALVAAWRDPSSPRLRLLAFGVVGIVLVYVPFYFDGNYPGGGARFYADALPFEHVIIAWGLTRLALGRFALPVAFAGFALHTSYDHRKLADRDGGLPMFEPRALSARRVASGLVFVDTDHAFALGFDARAWSTGSGVRVARLRNDANDWLLWDRAGRPPSFIYEFGARDKNPTPTLVPYTPLAPTIVALEGESNWPPLAVEGGGSVLPYFPACASRHRALLVRSGKAGDTTTVRLGISAPKPGSYRLRAGWVVPDSGRFSATIRFRSTLEEVIVSGKPNDCAVAGELRAVLGSSEEFVEISTTSEFGLDRLELLPDPER